MAISTSSGGLTHLATWLISSCSCCASVDAGEASFCTARLRDGGTLPVSLERIRGGTRLTPGGSWSCDKTTDAAGSGWRFDRRARISYTQTAKRANRAATRVSEMRLAFPELPERRLTMCSTQKLALLHQNTPRRAPWRARREESRTYPGSNRLRAGWDSSLPSRAKPFHSSIDRSPRHRAACTSHFS